MRLFVFAENKGIEHRVSVTPNVCEKLALNHEISIEKGAGEMAGFDDFSYKSSGGKISSKENIEHADVIFSINPLERDNIKLLKEKTILIGLQEPFNNSNNVILLRDSNITSFALDLIPRTTRAQYMDVLSSQANLAGYRAVLEAVHIFKRAIPLMMTSAGTIPAAKILVIGAGVAGLQAIATAKRLGASVSAFDVRASTKEQVESLGAKFVEIETNEKMDGVYADEMSDEYKKAQESKLRTVIQSQDIIITTAQIPEKKAPIIIKKDMVETMKSGSIIVDLASKTGGNCELTKHGEIVEKNGIKIVSFDNILNRIPFDASKLFAKNVFAFFELLVQKMSDQPEISKIDDDIIKSTLLTYNGKILNERIEKICQLSKH
ncbi:MAG: NAD(P) transhydrogenase subunit alpha [Holosporales bacterium]|jgi:NAD(P) transhydrogenase subunit alpha|nr:NAD(P) transhydrogenase subunit alpha [Holosporales bacterium]